MLYCADCMVQFDDESKLCPVCGSKKIRPVQNNDPVFLIYKSGIWTGIVEEVLHDNGIPFIKRDSANMAVRTYIGIQASTCNYYVPCGKFEQAAELMRELFENPEDFSDQDGDA